MNANEYINGMADLLRTTGADVRIEDIDGRKYPTLTICADFLGVSPYKAKKIVDECGRWL